MRPPTISFPFLPDLFNGFGEARGIVRLQGDEVVLEYEVRESILNIFKGDVKSVAIPLTEIVSVDFSRKWLSAHVTITCRSMRTVAAVPGMEQGKVRLGVAKADPAAAQDFETSFNLWSAERALSAVKRPVDDGELPE